MKHFLIVLLSLAVGGCASYFTRKNCEETNWFAYGEKLALSGKRVDEDTFVQQCRTVEADIKEGLLDRGFKKGLEAYCKPETAFLTGKKGEFFQDSMCQGLNTTEAKKQHRAGVVEFCNPENGHKVGASGQSYNNICPKELESAFLKEFNRGRVKYLKAELEVKESELTNQQKEVRELEKRISNTEGELRGITLLNAASSKENTHLAKRKEELEQDLRTLKNRENSAENQRKNLQRQIAEIKRELLTLAD